VKIQYCSDLHLEFEQNNKFLLTNPISVCGDILILAGDIVPLHDEFLNNPFFSLISEKFREVFWVPGNHEYYYNNISDYGSSFNIKVHDNIRIVNNIVLQIEGIRFIFSTLWSRISRANEKIIEQGVSDFECITNNSKKFRVADFNRLHDESLSFLRQSLTERADKTVVITHHLPSSLCDSHVHNASPIKEAFCVDLTDYIEESNANFWIYGHSHYNQKPLIVGKTILLTNQLGYIHLNEHDSFKQNAYFSI
jgi:Icc-related predicted phosphoesterase